MIEMVGIPTTLITVEAEESRQARPPRAVCPQEFGPGYSLGRANDAELQKEIIRDALAVLTAPPPLGEVLLRTY
jgi:hypothetical protein